MTLTGEIGHQDDHNTDPRVSPLKVMRSNAGFYLGTEFTHDGSEPPMPAGATEPNSRESGYFRTEEEANAALAETQAAGEVMTQPRDTEHRPAPFEVTEFNQTVLDEYLDERGPLD